MRRIRKLDRSFGFIVILAAGFIFCAEVNFVDLSITEIQMQPYRPTPGTPMTAVAMVKNSGSQATYDIHATAKLYGEKAYLQEIPNIPFLSSLPKGSTALSVPISLGALGIGKYRLEIILDPNHDIPDSNRTNNSLVKEFEVYDTP